MARTIYFENYEGYVTVIAALPPKQQGEQDAIEYTSMNEQV